MNTNYRTKVFIILVSGLFFSCDKKEKVDPKFNIEYQFINNGDPDIFLISGDVSTVFPEEHINDMKGRTISPSTYDTLVITPEYQGYPGVKMYMSISVRKQWNGIDNVRVWEWPARVVNNEQDRIMKFVYPDDTLHAIRTK